MTRYWRVIDCHVVFFCGFLLGFLVFSSVPLHSPSPRVVISACGRRRGRPPSHDAWLLSKICTGTILWLCAHHFSHSQTFVCKYSHALYANLRLLWTGVIKIQLFSNEPKSYDFKPWWTRLLFLRPRFQVRWCAWWSFEKASLGQVTGKIKAPRFHRLLSMARSLHWWTMVIKSSSCNLSINSLSLFFIINTALPGIVKYGINALCFRSHDILSSSALIGAAGRCYAEDLITINAM